MFAARLNLGVTARTPRYNIFHAANLEEFHVAEITSNKAAWPVL